MKKDLEYFKILHKSGLPKAEDVKKMVEFIRDVSNVAARINGMTNATERRNICENIQRLVNNYKKENE